jgi:amino acid permease
MAVDIMTVDNSNKRIAVDERTPLFVSQDTVSEQDEGGDGNASFRQTVINLMKFCMGTGCLVLPFAAQEGGIVLFCAGLLAIAAWNMYAVQRLVLCLQYVPNEVVAAVAGKAVAASCNTHPGQAEVDDEDHAGDRWEDLVEDHSYTISHKIERLPPPPQGTSTLGMVAWYAFGPVGLQALDIMMIMLLLGVITAYFAAIITFLADTPLTMGPFLDAVFTAIVMATISLVPNIGFLSHASAIGLVVLLGTFLVIAAYGISESLSQDIATLASSSSLSLPVWPESITGVSRWFGCVVFGFGVPPLTYNFLASMREPARLVPATFWGLTFVAVAYSITGVGLYALYPKLTGEILHELPQLGVLPILTRLAMVMVLWMSGPLLIVPCGQLLEGKWQTDKRAAVRFGICAVAVLVAVALPSFVQVISFVGCACIGMVSFCMPPLLHLRLSASSVDRTTVLLDCFMLAWGLIATVISTFYTI